MSNFRTLLPAFLVVTLIAAFGVTKSNVLKSADPKNSNQVVTRDIVLPNLILKVEVASTETEQSQGLSGRASLAPDRGMLFSFPVAAKYQFWMKDMNFPIDIIWIDEGGRVVDITENFLPETYPELKSPVLPAKYVLEVNSGFAKKHNLKIGSTIDVL